MKLLSFCRTEANAVFLSVHIHRANWQLLGGNHSAGSRRKLLGPAVTRAPARERTVCFASHRVSRSDRDGGGQDLPEGDPGRMHPSFLATAIITSRNTVALGLSRERADQGPDQEVAYSWNENDGGCLQSAQHLGTTLEGELVENVDQYTECDGVQAGDDS